AGRSRLLFAAAKRCPLLGASRGELGNVQTTLSTPRSSPPNIQPALVLHVEDHRLTRLQCVVMAVRFGVGPIRRGGSGARGGEEIQGPYLIQVEDKGLPGLDVAGEITKACQVFDVFMVHVFSRGVAVIEVESDPRTVEAIDGAISVEVVY
ncbi:MAG: hypothetical protein V2B18_06525, partial [Pseudomonadota bacterium]